MPLRKTSSSAGPTSFNCEKCQTSVEIGNSAYLKSNLSSSVLKLCNDCTSSLRTKFEHNSDEYNSDEHNSDENKSGANDCYETLCNRIASLETAIQHLFKRLDAPVDDKGPNSSVSGKSKLLPHSIQSSKKLASQIQSGNNIVIDECVQSVPGNPQTPKVVHQIIIKKAADTETFADKVKTSLKNIPVKKMAMTKSGDGIISFPSQSHRDEALCQLSDLNPIPEDSNQRPLHPKITIYGLPNDDYIPDDETSLNNLHGAILNKNAHIKELVKEGKVFDLLFIRKDSKKPSCNYAVAKLDPDVLKAIRLNNHKIFIDFNSCHVSERIHLIQCYQCQKFGHKKDSDDCKYKNSKKQVCMYCSGDHKSSNCQTKADKKFQAFKCANCADSSSNNQEISHATTSSKCPIRLRQINNVINKTMGYEGLSKNSLRNNAIIT